MKINSAPIGCILSAALAAACAGPGPRTKKSVAELLAAGDYAGAAASIQAKAPEYSPSNYVLYHLDLGLALHYAGRWRESSRSFEAVEATLDELYTKSVTAAAGRLIANENIADYRGHPSDRTLALLFDALNQVMLGKDDEALASIRRMEAFLDGLGGAPRDARAYVDDGLARYIAALLYGEQGKIDDARISHEAAQRAYARYPALYGTPIPPLPGPSIAPGQGEIVFLHYSGPAPRKISVAGSGPSAPEAESSPRARAAGIVDAAKRAADATVKTAVDIAGEAAKAVTGVLLNTAHPEYIQDAYLITGSELHSSNGDAATFLYADLLPIAARDLRDELALLKARSALRAALKLAQQAATGIDASGSEFADIRCWSLLPAQIRMARLALKPGLYRIELRYTNQGGAARPPRALDVEVKAGRRTWVLDRTFS